MKVVPSALPEGGIWIVLGAAVLMSVLWVLLSGLRGRRARRAAQGEPRPSPGIAPGAGPREAQAERVVAACRARLVGRSLDGARVCSVLHYGAVDIDPRHLVVWILLDGRGAEQVPGWYAPGSGADLPPGWDAALVALADEVRTAFAQDAWPDPASIRVLVDADARVRAGGGWSYFR
jgi:hypothetical protein